MARIRRPAARRHDAVVDARGWECAPALSTPGRGISRTARLPNVNGQLTHFIARINATFIVVKERRAGDGDQGRVRIHVLVLAIFKRRTAVPRTVPPSAEDRRKHDPAVVVGLLVYIPLSAADVARDDQLVAKPVGRNAATPLIAIRVRGAHLGEIVVLDEDVVEPGAILLGHRPNSGVVVALIPVNESTSESGVREAPRDFIVH